MAGGHRSIEVALGAEHAGWRLDRALAAALPTLSRERLKVLIRSGALTASGKALRDPAAKVARRRSLHAGHPRARAGA